MATPVIVPPLGQSVAQGSIGKWLKKQGDYVRRGEPLLEVETEKVTVEITAPISGRLQETSVPAGAAVEVGAKIGEIDEAAAGPDIFSRPAAQSIERPKSWVSRFFGQ